MFKIIERYIAKNIIMATAITSLIISSVLFVMALLAEFKVIGDGDYGIWQAVMYVVYRMPNDIYQFSPMLILLGSIIGLSTLTSHRELMVMRASGFSVKQIILSVFMAAFLLIAVISMMGEWLAPNLSYSAEIRKESERNAGQAVVTATGVWLHVDNDFIHIQNAIGRQLLEGVTRYQFDNEHHLQVAYYAKTLVNENGQWVMHDVVMTTFYDERTKSQTIASMPWNLKFNANLFNFGLADPNEMSLQKLAKFVHYLKKNGLQATEYEYQFWQRVLQPLAALVMVFLAIPFVLGTLRSSAMGWRVVIGIVVGFIFYISNALLGQLSIVYQVPVLFAALLPIVIFAGIGFLLTKTLVRR